MNQHKLTSFVPQCAINRRRFLAGCAACMGSAAFLGTDAVAATEPREKLRIRIVYSLHAEKQPRPDWPNIGFDFAPVMQRINTELGKRLRNFELVPCMAAGEQEAKKIVEDDKAAGDIDGYLVYQMNCWNRVVQTIAGSGKPVLYADFQFGGSGGFLVYNATFLRNKAANVGFVASSRMSDVVEAMKSFELIKKGGTVADFVSATERVRLKTAGGPGATSAKKDPVNCLSASECVARLKQCKILAVRDQNSGSAGEIMGIPVVNVPFSEVNEAWAAADKDEVRAVADQWHKSAAKIEGVSRETLETSAAMYLAQKTVMKKHGANAITMNCLGGFYGGHIHAYPCLGFHQLLNEGLIGACECDVRSTATMVAMTTLTRGRPGYISDPVIDTAKHQIIYAHCVASNKAFGPDGKANPFQILTHSEDRKGASVRSLLPLGYMTTTVEFEHSWKEILLHRAKVVENDPDDRACRTKLCGVPVGDIEKLFTEWDRWGWHRVTVYGDLKEPVYALADALGWKVTEQA